LSSGQEEGTEATSIPGLEELRARLSEAESERAALFSQLGAAALDGNDGRVRALEGQLDSLEFDRAGLSAQIAQLEAAEASSDERERRRREAMERERARRELSGVQLELYDGCSEHLEHAARVAAAAQELERLRSAQPFDPADLVGLSERLETAGVEVDLTFRELESSTDPSQLREAARKYQTLARSIREDQRRREAQGAPDQGSARAESSTELPTAESAETRQQPTSEAADGDEAGPAEPQAGGEPSQATTAASQEAVPLGPATASDERTSPGSGGTLRLFEEEERRLRSWRDSLERQGDPLGILGEVNRQLDEIIAKRAALLRSADGVGGRAEGS